MRTKKIYENGCLSYLKVNNSFFTQQSITNAIENQLNISVIYRAPIDSVSTAANIISLTIIFSEADIDDSGDVNESDDDNDEKTAKVISIFMYKGKEFIIQDFGSFFKIKPKLQLMDTGYILDIESALHKKNKENQADFFWLVMTPLILLILYLLVVLFE